MAIHCEPVTEPHHPSCHREPPVGVAIHWTSVTEQTTRTRISETRWIAASLTPLPPRNDKVRCHREGVARGGPLSLTNRSALSED